MASKSWQQKRKFVCSQSTTTTTTRSIRKESSQLSSSLSMSRRDSDRPLRKQQVASTGEDNSTVNMQKNLDLVSSYSENNNEQHQPTSGRQLSSMIARKRNQQVADLQQQQQSIHNDNISNNRNGKVRLMLLPATLDNNNYGSKQQQVAINRSTTLNGATVESAAKQIQRSHNKQLQDRNYHHYDYYTDSDLTSSQLATNQANRYDENILLFATEHNKTTNHNDKGSNNSTNNKQTFDIRYGQVEQSGLQQQPAGHSHCMLDHPSVKYRGLTLGRQGKFVDSYPSWRQTQSPTSNYTQNYSFHVPFNSHSQLSDSQRSTSRSNTQSTNLQGGNSHNYQARYGSVAPSERVNSSSHKPFNSSLRSKTISHLPNLVKVSVEDTGMRTYEDFYDRPSLDSSHLNKQHMMSEGNLLKAHVIDCEEGYDNPFKPGTELSWEADLMVRLMKRGYPIKELPVLVETAKQVAIEKLSPNSGCNNGNYNKLNISGGQLNETEMEKFGEDIVLKATESCRNIRESEKFRDLRRRQSSFSDLTSGKQVWANSLNRAKSMPRFLSTKTNYDDNDSIDKLISSIENEMDLIINGNTVNNESPLLAESQESHSRKFNNELGTKRKVSNVPNNKTGIRTGTSSEQRVSKKQVYKIHSKEEEEDKRKNKEDLIRYNKKKMGRENECCKIH